MPPRLNATRRRSKSTAWSNLAETCHRCHRRCPTQSHPLSPAQRDQQLHRCTAEPTHSAFPMGTPKYNQFYPDVPKLLLTFVITHDSR
eukprot:gene18576-21729_t